jgi:hypothetical protein
MVQASVLLSGGGDNATIGSCGAFSGGLMALSIKFSPRSEKLSEEQIKEWTPVKLKLHEFRDWFMDKFGGVTCEKVQYRQFGRSFNLMNEKELIRFREMRENCVEVYTNVALKIAEMLCREDIR